MATANFSTLTIAVADWIASRTSFVKGTTLQVNNFSLTAPERCIAVSLNGGCRDYPDQVIRFDQNVQITTRSRNWNEAADDCSTVHNMIHVNRASHFNLPITGTPLWRVETIESQGGPQRIGEYEGFELYVARYTFNIFRV